MPVSRRRKPFTRNAMSPDRTSRRRDPEVLAAAAKVFHARSYADTSVQNIADELGMLKGGLYYYIESKEDLFFWLLSEIHDDLQRNLDQVVADSELEPLEALREYVRRNAAYASQNPTRMSVYYQSFSPLSRARREELIAKRRAYEDLVTRLIAGAQAAAGVERCPEPQVTTNLVFGSVTWIYRWFRPGEEAESADLADRCVDFILHGVSGAS